MVNVAGGKSVALAVAAGALTGMTAPSDGALMRSMANDPQHRLLGQNYLMGGSGVATTGGAAGSFQIAVAGGGIRVGSGGFLNGDYYLTAAHSLDGLTITDPTSITVATGPNSISNRGQVRTVAEIIYSPWGAGSNPNLPDLVAFRLSSPISGINPAVIAGAGVGAMLTHTGFGNYGDPATGELFTDGNMRGFRAPIESFVNNGYNPAYYVQTRFSSGVSDVLNGRGLPRDSGGFVWTTSGDLFGSMVAATLGTGEFGGTYIQQFSNPEVGAWLATIPSPGAAGLLGLAGLVFAARRRRD